MKKTDTIIIGAGPVGFSLFTELGIKGLKSVIIGSFDKAGGQCIELYPDKPIMIFQLCQGITGRITKNFEQIKLRQNFLNEELGSKQDEENWIVKTNNDKEAPNIIVAGSVGSVDPKLPVKEPKI